MRVAGRCLALTAVLSIGACGEGTTTGSAGGASAEDVLGPEQISFGSSLAQMRGHQRVALELFGAGDAAAAEVHARHPVEEILASVRSEVEEHDEALADRLENALEEGASAVAHESPRAEVVSAFDETRQLTYRAERAVLGDQRDSDAYRGSVIAALLSVAAHEYAESIRGSNIALAVEYQDGYGFLQEAQFLYEDVAPAVEKVSDEEAEEVEEAFAVLGDAFPGPRPPARAMPAEDVEVAAELVGHELEETVAARLLEEADPEEVAEEIESLLDRLVAAYRAGEAEEASELAAEAYLENYEVIEAEVIEKAPEVNEELEPLLGAELRKRIQEGASQQEIRSMIARIERLLDQAVAALEEE